jgi:hypothetical protein
MKLDVDQRSISFIEESLLDNILNNIEEDDWYIDDYRCEDPAMTAVNSIPIFHSASCTTCSDALLTVEKRKLFNKFYPLIEPILNELKVYYDYNFHASFLARLNPRRRIELHVDSGDFLMRGHRVHVPIKTNEDVKYVICNNEYYWEKGKIYEFDNSLVHGVINNSDEDRIHLVLNLYKLPEDELSRLNTI